MTDSRPVVCQLVHTLNVGGAEVLAGNLAVDYATDTVLCSSVWMNSVPAPEAVASRKIFRSKWIGRKPGLDWALARCGWHRSGNAKASNSFKPTSTRAVLLRPVGPAEVPPSAGRVHRARAALPRLPAPEAETSPTGCCSAAGIALWRWGVR